MLLSTFCVNFLVKLMRKTDIFVAHGAHGHILCMKTYFTCRAFEQGEKGRFRMKIDRNALRRILTLSDAQLRFIIGRIAAEAGVDISGMDMSPGALDALRRAVESASDEELEKITAELLGSKRGG